MNPKSITHVASMPGRKRERERERESPRKGERLRSTKKARVRYHCSSGGGTIFDLLKALPQKNKRKQRKTFYGCPITEAEDEEGSLKEDRRTKHLPNCYHQG